MPLIPSNIKLLLLLIYLMHLRTCKQNNVRNFEDTDNRRRKGDLGEINKTKKEMNFENLRKRGSLINSPNKEKTLHRIKSTLDLGKGDLGLNHKNNKNHDLSSKSGVTSFHKKDELYHDAIALYNSKQPIDDPSMSAMQSSVLVEQKNERNSLKDDSQFEQSAMEQLSQDEKAMNNDEDKIFDDEKKVKADEKRKFGKHRKEKTKKINKYTESKEKDLDNKLKEFVDSFSQKTSKNIKHNTKNTETKEQEFDEKLNNFVKSFSPQQSNESVSKQKRDFPEHDSETFPGLDEKSLKLFAKDREDETDSTATASQILGNIASIFENVNAETDAGDPFATQKKDIIPKPKSKSFDAFSVEPEDVHQVMRKDQVFNGFEIPEIKTMQKRSATEKNHVSKSNDDVSKHGNIKQVQTSEDQSESVVDITEIEPPKKELIEAHTENENVGTDGLIGSGAFHYEIRNEKNVRETEAKTKDSIHPSLVDNTSEVNNEQTKQIVNPIDPTVVVQGNEEPNTENILRVDTPLASLNKKSAPKIDNASESGSGTSDQANFIVLPKTANGTENSSSVVMDKIANEVVKTPSLRDRYLYQLTHQFISNKEEGIDIASPVQTKDFINNNNEQLNIKNVLSDEGSQSEGEDDIQDGQIVWKEFYWDCGSGSGSGSGKGTGCKLKPVKLKRKDREKEKKREKKKKKKKKKGKKGKKSEKGKKGGKGKKEKKRKKGKSEENSDDGDFDYPAEMPESRPPPNQKAPPVSKKPQVPKTPPPPQQQPQPNQQQPPNPYPLKRKPKKGGGSKVKWSRIGTNPQLLPTWNNIKSIPIQGNSAETGSNDAAMRAAKRNTKEKAGMTLEYNAKEVTWTAKDKKKTGVTKNAHVNINSTKKDKGPENKDIEAMNLVYNVKEGTWAAKETKKIKLEKQKEQPSISITKNKKAKHHNESMHLVSSTKENTWTAKADKNINPEETDVSVNSTKKDNAMHVIYSTKENTWNDKNIKMSSGRKQKVNPAKKAKKPKGSNSEAMKLEYNAKEGTWSAKETPKINPEKTNKIDGNSTKKDKKPKNVSNTEGMKLEYNAREETWAAKETLKISPEKTNKIDGNSTKKDKKPKRVSNTERMKLEYNAREGTWTAKEALKISPEKTNKFDGNSTKKDKKPKNVSNTEGMKLEYNAREGTWTAKEALKISPEKTNKFDGNSTKKDKKPKSASNTQGMQLIYNAKDANWQAVDQGHKVSSKETQGVNNTRRSSSNAAQDNAAMVPIFNPEHGTWMAVEHHKVVRGTNITSMYKKKKKKDSNKDSEGMDLVYHQADGTWLSTDKKKKGKKDGKKHKKNKSDELTTSEFESEKKFEKLAAKEGYSIFNQQDDQTDSIGILESNSVVKPTGRQKRDMVFYIVSTKEQADGIEERKLRKKLKHKHTKKVKPLELNHEGNLGEIGKPKSRRKRIKMIMTRKRKFISNDADMNEESGIKLRDLSEQLDSSADVSGEEDVDDEEEIDESGSGSSDPLEQRSVITTYKDKADDHDTMTVKERNSMKNSITYVPLNGDTKSSVKPGILEMRIINQTTNKKNLTHSDVPAKKSNFHLHNKNYFPKIMVLNSVRHRTKDRKATIKRSKTDHNLKENDDASSMKQHIESNHFYSKRGHQPGYSIDSDDDNDEISSQNFGKHGRHEHIKNKKRNPINFLRVTEKTAKVKNTSCCAQSQDDEDWEYNCCGNPTDEIDLSCCDEQPHEMPQDSSLTQITWDANSVPTTTAQHAPTAFNNHATLGEDEFENEQPEQTPVNLGKLLHSLSKNETKKNSHQTKATNKNSKEKHKQAHPKPTKTANVIWKISNNKKTHPWGEFNVPVSSVVVPFTMHQIPHKPVKVVWGQPYPLTTSTPALDKQTHRPESTTPCQMASSAKNNKHHDNINNGCTTHVAHGSSEGTNINRPKIKSGNKVKTTDIPIENKQDNFKPTQKPGHTLITTVTPCQAAASPDNNNKSSSGKQIHHAAQGHGCSTPVYNGVTTFNSTQSVETPTNTDKEHKKPPKEHKRPPSGHPGKSHGSPPHKGENLETSTDLKKLSTPPWIGNKPPPSSEILIPFTEQDYTPKPVKVIWGQVKKMTTTPTTAKPKVHNNKTTTPTPKPRIQKQNHNETNNKQKSHKQPSTATIHEAHIKVKPNMVQINITGKQPKLQYNKTQAKQPMLLIQEKIKGNTLNRKPSANKEKQRPFGWNEVLNQKTKNNKQKPVWVQDSNSIRLETKHQPTKAPKHHTESIGNEKEKEKPSVNKPGKSVNSLRTTSTPYGHRNVTNKKLKTTARPTQTFDHDNKDTSTVKIMTQPSTTAEAGTSTETSTNTEASTSTEVSTSTKASTTEQPTITTPALTTCLDCTKTKTDTTTYNVQTTTPPPQSGDISTQTQASNTNVQNETTTPRDNQNINAQSGLQTTSIPETTSTQEATASTEEQKPPTVSTIETTCSPCQSKETTSPTETPTSKQNSNSGNSDTTIQGSSSTNHHENSTSSGFTTAKPTQTKESNKEGSEEIEGSGEENNKPDGKNKNKSNKHMPTTTMYTPPHSSNATRLTESSQKDTTTTETPEIETEVTTTERPKTTQNYMYTQFATNLPTIKVTSKSYKILCLPWQWPCNEQTPSVTAPLTTSRRVTAASTLYSSANNSTMNETPITKPTPPMENTSVSSSALSSGSNVNSQPGGTSSDESNGGTSLQPAEINSTSSTESNNSQSVASQSTGSVQSAQGTSCGTNAGVQSVGNTGENPNGVSGLPCGTNTEAQSIGHTNNTAIGIAGAPCGMSSGTQSVGINAGTQCTKIISPQTTSSNQNQVQQSSENNNNSTKENSNNEVESSGEEAESEENSKEIKNQSPQNKLPSTSTTLCGTMGNKPCGNGALCVPKPGFPCSLSDLNIVELPTAQQGTGEQPKVIAQPVIPLMPINVPCVPTAGNPCNPPNMPCVPSPGMPCPVYNLPEKIPVWAIETVETTIQNVPQVSNQTEETMKNDDLKLPEYEHNKIQGPSVAHPTSELSDNTDIMNYGTVSTTPAGATILTTTSAVVQPQQYGNYGYNYPTMKQVQQTTQPSRETTNYAGVVNKTLNIQTSTHSYKEPVPEQQLQDKYPTTTQASAAKVYTKHTSEPRLSSPLQDRFTKASKPKTQPFTNGSTTLAATPLTYVYNLAPQEHTTQQKQAATQGQTAPQKGNTMETTTFVSTSPSTYNPYLPINNTVESTNNMMENNNAQQTAYRETATPPVTTTSVPSTTYNPWLPRIEVEDGEESGDDEENVVKETTTTSTPRYQETTTTSALSYQEITTASALTYPETTTTSVPTLVTSTAIPSTTFNPWLPRVETEDSNEEESGDDEEDEMNKKTTTTSAPMYQETTTTSAPIYQETTTTSPLIYQETTTTSAPSYQEITTTSVPAYPETTTTSVPTFVTSTSIPSATFNPWLPRVETDEEESGDDEEDNINKETMTTSAPAYQETTTTSSPIYQETTTTSAPTYPRTTATSAPTYQATMTTTPPTYQETTTTTPPAYQETTTLSSPIYQEITATTPPKYKETTTTSLPIYQETTTASAPTYPKTSTTSVPTQEETTTTGAPTINPWLQVTEIKTPTFNPWLQVTESTKPTFNPWLPVKSESDQSNETDTDLTTTVSTSTTVLNPETTVPTNTLIQSETTIQPAYQPDATNNENTTDSTSINAQETTTASPYLTKTQTSGNQPTIASTQNLLNVVPTVTTLQPTDVKIESQNPSEEIGKNQPGSKEESNSYYEATQAPSRSPSTTSASSILSSLNRTTISVTKASSTFKSTPKVSEPDYTIIGPKDNSHNKFAARPTTKIPTVVTTTIKSSYQYQNPYTQTTAQPTVPLTTAPVNEVNDTALKLILGNTVSEKESTNLLARGNVSMDFASKPTLNAKPTTDGNEPDYDSLGPKSNDKTENEIIDELEDSASRTEVLNMDQQQNKPSPGQISPMTTPRPSPTPSRLVAASKPDEELHEALEEKAREDKARADVTKKPSWSFNLNPMALPPAYMTLNNYTNRGEIEDSSGEDENENTSDNTPTYSPARDSQLLPMDEPSSNTIVSNDAESQTTLQTLDTTINPYTGNIEFVYDTVADDIVTTPRTILYKTTQQASVLKTSSTPIVKAVGEQQQGGGSVYGFASYDAYLKEYYQSLSNSYHYNPEATTSTAATTVDPNIVPETTAYTTTLLTHSYVSPHPNVDLATTLKPKTVTPETTVSSAINAQSVTVETTQSQQYQETTTLPPPLEHTYATVQTTTKPSKALNAVIFTTPSPPSNVPYAVTSTISSAGIQPQTTIPSMETQVTDSTTTTAQMAWDPTALVWATATAATVSTTARTIPIPVISQNDSDIKNAKEEDGGIFSQEGNIEKEQSHYSFTTVSTNVGTSTKSLSKQKFDDAKQKSNKPEEVTTTVTTAGLQSTSFPLNGLNNGIGNNYLNPYGYAVVETGRNETATETNVTINYFTPTTMQSTTTVQYSNDESTSAPITKTPLTTTEVPATAPDKTTLTLSSNLTTTSLLAETPQPIQTITEKVPLQTEYETVYGFPSYEAYLANFYQNFQNPSLQTITAAPTTTTAPVYTPTTPEASTTVTPEIKPTTSAFNTPSNRAIQKSTEAEIVNFAEDDVQEINIKTTNKPTTSTTTPETPTFAYTKEQKDTDEVTLITTTSMSPTRRPTTTLPNLETETVSTDDDKKPEDMSSVKPTSRVTTKLSENQTSFEPERPSAIPIVTMEIEIVPKTNSGFESNPTPSSITTLETTATTQTTTTTTDLPGTKHFEDKDEERTSVPNTEEFEDNNLKGSNGEGKQGSFVSTNSLNSGQGSSYSTQSVSQNLQDTVVTTRAPTKGMENIPLPSSTNKPLEEAIKEKRSTMMPGEDEIEVKLQQQPLTTEATMVETPNWQFRIQTEKSDNSQENKESSEINIRTSPKPFLMSTNENNKIVSEVNSFVENMMTSNSETVKHESVVPYTKPMNNVSTKYPYNDLYFDYLLNWRRYLQGFQSWVNRYMVPLEHKNITVYPNRHPTLNPLSSRYQKEYESYLAEMEVWEAKNRVMQIMGFTTTKSPVSLSLSTVDSPRQTEQSKVTSQAATASEYQTTTLVPSSSTSTKTTAAQITPSQGSSSETTSTPETSTQDLQTSSKDLEYSTNNKQVTYDASNNNNPTTPLSAPIEAKGDESKAESFNDVSQTYITKSTSTPSDVTTTVVTQSDVATTATIQSGVTTTASTLFNKGNDQSTGDNSTSSQINSEDYAVTYGQDTTTSVVNYLSVTTTTSFPATTTPAIETTTIAPETTTTAPEITTVAPETTPTTPKIRTAPPSSIEIFDEDKNNIWNYDPLFTNPSSQGSTVATAESTFVDTADNVMSTTPITTTTTATSESLNTYASGEQGISSEDTLPQDIITTVSNNDQVTTTATPAPPLYLYQGYPGYVVPEYVVPLVSINIPTDTTTPAPTGYLQPGNLYYVATRRNVVTTTTATDVPSNQTTTEASGIPMTTSSPPVYTVVPSTTLSNTGRIDNNNSDSVIPQVYYSPTVPELATNPSSIDSAETSQQQQQQQQVYGVTPAYANTNVQTQPSQSLLSKVVNSGAKFKNEKTSSTNNTFPKSPTLKQILTSKIHGPSIASSKSGPLSNNNRNTIPTQIESKAEVIKQNPSISLTKLLMRDTPISMDNSQDPMQDLATQLATKDVISNGDLANNFNSNRGASVIQESSNYETAPESSDIKKGDIPDEPSLELSENKKNELPDETFLESGESEKSDIESETSSDTSENKKDDLPADANGNEQAEGLYEQSENNYRKGEIPSVLDTSKSYDPIASLMEHSYENVPITHHSDIAKPSNNEPRPNIMDFPPTNDEIDWGKELVVNSYLKDKKTRDKIPSKHSYLNERITEFYPNFLERSYFPKLHNLNDVDIDAEILPEDDDKYRRKRLIKD